MCQCHSSLAPSPPRSVKLLHAYVNPANGELAPLVSDELSAVVQSHAAALDAAMVYERDMDYNYFGFKTLERSYLLRIDGRVVERPSHLLMRVSLGIHGADVASALSTYDALSRRLFTHASPTLFNAGTPRPQLSSCFLLTMKDDSIEGIYDTLKQCAVISKCAGGIGLSIHNIRATSSYIRGTNGTSNGILPMLRVFNNTARYVDQGGGKRKGASAPFLTLGSSALTHAPLRQAPLPFIWSLGTRTSSTSWRLARTPARRRLARATCSTACGSRTCS